MPIQITMTDGLISKEKAQEMHQAIGALLLDTHQIPNNPFMLPNVVGEVVFVDKDLCFAGLNVSPLAIVELRVPSFTFATQDQKDQFVSQATNIVLSAAGGKIDKSSIWVNAVYAVDGMWGIAGKAYNNEDLIGAIQNQG